MALAQALSGNQVFKALDISRNPIGKAGIVAVLQALKTCKCPHQLQGPCHMIPSSCTLHGHRIAQALPWRTLTLMALLWTRLPARLSTR